MIRHIIGGKNAFIQTIKGHLRFWTAAVILMMGIMIVSILYVLAVNYRINVLFADMQEKLAHQSLFMEQWAMERNSDLRQIAARDVFRNLDLPAMQRSLNVFVGNQNQFEALIYGDRAGVTVLSTSYQTGVDISDRDYFTAAQKGKDYISEVLTSRASGEPVIIFSTPVLDERGEFAGLLFGTVGLETIRQTMERVPFALTEKTYLTDRYGSLIVKPADYEGGGAAPRLDTPIFQRALAQSGETSAYEDYRGLQVFGGYRWSADRRWCIIREVDQSAAYELLYKIMTVISLVTALILGITYGAVVLLADRVNRPIAFMLQGTKIIRDGYYDYRIDPSVFRRSPVELQQLCDTFNVMSGKLKETIGLLERFAMIDPLTGLYNRRYLANEGNRMVEASLKSQQPVSVLALDIDRFKKVNDTYGHPVGDRVLKHVASLLKRHAINEDIAARYGGEEFVLVCLRAGGGQSMALAETLRSAIASSPFEEDDLQLKVTVSIGVSSSEAGRNTGCTLEELIAHADKALYQAKQTGRNKVVFGTEDGPGHKHS